MLKKSSQDNQSVNLLPLIAERNVEWREIETGKVILLKPKFKNEFIKKYLGRWMKETHYQIHLDQFGSFVWLKIDGRRSVHVIGEELQKQFGKEIEPVYERLGKFISQLHRGNFIKIYQK